MVEKNLQRAIFFNMSPHHPPTPCQYRDQKAALERSLEWCSFLILFLVWVGKLGLHHSNYSDYPPSTHD